MGLLNTPAAKSLIAEYHNMNLKYNNKKSLNSKPDSE